MNRSLYLFRQKNECRIFLGEMRNQNKTIGFVPTMGALHKGHTSIIERARNENNLVVCSIFVNPAQFNDPQDFEKYPRPIETDIEILTGFDCDVLFLPDEKEIYPAGGESLEHYDLNGLENFLEGAARPGHFQGVANVVDRLLQIIEPDRLYLGQKDFQQIKVIDRMVQQTGTRVQIVMCQIVREESGLALSSRNVRLSPEQKKNAAIISQTLIFIQNNFQKHSLQELKSMAISKINSMPETSVDYLEFCDSENFRLIENHTEAHHIVCVTAVKVGEVRLLDNIILK